MKYKEFQSDTLCITVGDFITHTIDTVYQQGLETEVTHVISLYKFPI